MKKLLSLFLAAAMAAPVMAPAATPKMSTLITQLESCEAIIKEFQGNSKLAIPPQVLRQAKGIIIINQFQASFFLGVKDGYGVILVRRPNGRWSVPAFLKAGDISLGLQFGGRAINTVMVLMDEETPRRLFQGRVNFGTDAKVVAGIRASEAELVTNPLPAGANVLVYTNQEGLMAGVALKTGYVSPDDKANQVYYNTRHRLPELLYSDWVTPPADAQYLIQYIEGITR
jgi:SH3 domain-containing YSC84-like protein 1